MLQGKMAILGFDPARMAGAVVVLACSAVVALTGSAGLHGSSAAGVSSSAPAVVAFSAGVDHPCDDYVLSLDEVEAAEKAWPEQRDDMLKRAQEWSPNAVLVQLNLNCDFFDNEGNAEEPHGGIRWNGVFYDANGVEHLYWHSATGESYFVFEDTALDPAQISFKQLNDWLDQADFDGDHRIVALVVTKNLDSKPEPDDHFSYVLSYVDKNMKMFEVIVDSRDGAISEKAI